MLCLRMRHTLQPRSRPPLPSWASVLWFCASSPLLELGPGLLNGRKRVWDGSRDMRRVGDPTQHRCPSAPRGRWPRAPGGLGRTDCPAWWTKCRRVRWGCSATHPERLAKTNVRARQARWVLTQGIHWREGIKCWEVERKMEMGGLREGWGDVLRDFTHGRLMKNSICERTNDRKNERTNEQTVERTDGRKTNTRASERKSK